VLTVRGADLLWTGTAEIPGGEVVCDDLGSVTTTPAAGGGEVLDASGCVITPGLVNAHHHLMQSLFRTLPGTRGVPMREWLPTMAAAYARAGVDVELCARAARVGLAESLLCGVTTVADHHLTWPAGLPDRGVGIATAVADTATELGARLVFVRGSARDDPQEAAASADAIATALAGRPGVQVAVGPAGVHSDAPETFALLGEVAARHGLRRRTQANEQVDVEIALERYGRRPLELLDEWGWLAPDVILGPDRLVAVDALVALRERLRGRVEIQLCLLAGYEAETALIEEAVARGIDVLGGCPPSGAALTAAVRHHGRRRLPGGASDGSLEPPSGSVVEGSERVHREERDDHADHRAARSPPSGLDGLGFRSRRTG
jgi:hypothetical protein